MSQFSLIRVSAIVWRHFYLLPKSFDRLTDTFFWPLLDILLWGLTTRWISQASQVADNILLSILISLMFWRIVWFSNYEVGVNLLEECWSKNFTNIVSTPLNKLEWLIGNLLVGLMKLSASLVVSSIAILLVYHVNVFTLGWAWVPFALSLIIFGWCVGFLSSAIVLVIGIRAQALTWTLAFLFAPLCATYFPKAMLPGWLQPLSAAFPATYVFEAMRGAVLDGHTDWALWGSSVLLNVFYLICTLWLFNWTFERSRDRGFDHLE